MNNKNLTRYTYENTDFQGWRVSIQRCGRIITRYFSDMQYGSEEESRAAAVEYRDAVFSDMQAHRNDLAEFMDHELEHVQQLLREKGSSAISHHRGR
ncbi:MAG: hypothetical protein IKY91_04205 [Akkermansia sp.]|nr:hypothetical protein [Akkermansia sp.]